MFTKKHLGIMTVLLGVVLLFSSFYIKNKVLLGKYQISKAQGALKQGNNTCSFNPLTKEFSERIVGKVQKKIDEVNKKIIFYSNLALWFKIIGIVFIVLGFLLIFIHKKKKPIS
jgi:hypothetical protein